MRIGKLMANGKKVCCVIFFGGICREPLKSDVALWSVPEDTQIKLMF